MTIPSSTIKENNYRILTPEQVYHDLDLRHTTYFYILLDQGRLDKAYPYPKRDDDGKLIKESGPIFVVVNEKYEELKEYYKEKRKKK